MRDLFPLCTMEQISQIHYARPFPFSFHSSVNGVIFDKIYRKLIGKNTPDRFFIRIFALFGYKYLVCAIVISMRDSYLLNGVTTKLCSEIARRYGVNVVGSEVIGLVPMQALIDCAEYYLQIENFSSDQILESRL